MTEQERNEAIRKIETLKDQGILTNEEYIEKVALLAEKKPRQQPQQPARKGSDGKAVLIFIACLVLAVIGYFVSQQMQEDKSKSATTISSQSNTATTTSRPKKSYPYGVPAVGYTDSGTNFNSNDKELAKAFAEVYVKRQLKSPSTAKFPSNVDSYTYKREGNEWAVAGWVDATNSYGATIRTTWISSFTITWDGGKYHGEEVGTYIVE